jgi:uncharacterized protein (TIGR03085 family)
MPHYAVDERHSLAATLRRTSPDSPTLCGEWTVAQLAAHLVLRERSLVELGGRLPIRALQERAARTVDELAARGRYEQLVAAIDAGPSWKELAWPVPVAWMWSLPPVREGANLLEYLVHHEDVRRAGGQWEPRPVAVAVQRAVWQRLHLLARVTLRTVPVGVVLFWPSHGEIRSRLAKRGAPVVTVTGDPVELALFGFGRLGVAQVEFAGAPADIEAVRTADIRL